MGRTTDEWAALLDGTTPGPWEVETSSIFPANEKNGDGGYIQEYWLHFDDYHDGIDCNSELIDHAPAAVAEVIRLRRALEEQRDRFRSHAKADSYLAEIGTVPLVPFYGDQADLLDRILNGGTDD